MEEIGEFLHSLGIPNPDLALALLVFGFAAIFLFVIIREKARRKTGKDILSKTAMRGGRSLLRGANHSKKENSGDIRRESGGDIPKQNARKSKT